MNQVPALARGRKLGTVTQQYVDALCSYIPYSKIKLYKSTAEWLQRNREDVPRMGLEE